MLGNGTLGSLLLERGSHGSGILLTLHLLLLQDFGDLMLNFGVGLSALMGTLGLFGHVFALGILLLLTVQLELRTLLLHHFDLRLVLLNLGLLLLLDLLFLDRLRLLHAFQVEFLPL